MITSQQINSMMMQQNMMMHMGSSSSNFSPAQGASQYPPSFNYGLNVGPGSGSYSSQAAGGLGQMVAGAPKALMGAASVASMATMIPGVGGMAGGALGALGSMDAGAGLMALAMGNPLAALPAAGLAGATFGAHHFGRGIGFQQNVDGMLSNMSFANAGSFAGRGFSRQQAFQVGQGLRNINTSSSFISQDDVLNMGQQFNNMGMQQGITNVGELTKKLEDFGKMAETVARQMGTSIKDVEQVLAQNRQIGFYSGADVAGNTSNMMMAQGLGMNNQQFLGTQQGLSSMMRGRGLTGSSGARFGANNMIDLQMMMSMGSISDTKLMDLTDTATRSDAAAAFTQSTAGRLANFLQNQSQASPLLLGLAQFDDKTNKFTGGIDQKAMDAFNRGNLSVDQLLQRGAARTGTETGALSYKTNKDQIVGNMLSSPESMYQTVNLLQEFAQDAGFGDNKEDAMVVLGQKFNLGSEKEMRMMMEVAKQYRKNARQRKLKFAEELAAQEYQDNFRRNYTIGGNVQKVTGGISDAMEPLAAEGSYMYSRSADLMEKGVARFFGADMDNSMMANSVESSINDAVLGDFTDADFGQQTQGMKYNASASILKYASGTAEQMRIVGAARNRDMGTLMDISSSQLDAKGSLDYAPAGYEDYSRSEYLKAFGKNAAAGGHNRQQIDSIASKVRELQREGKHQEAKKLLYGNMHAGSAKNLFFNVSSMKKHKRFDLLSASGALDKGMLGADNLAVDVMLEQYGHGDIAAEAIAGSLEIQDERTTVQSISSMREEFLGSVKTADTKINSRGMARPALEKFLAGSGTGNILYGDEASYALKEQALFGGEGFTTLASKLASAQDMKTFDDMVTAEYKKGGSDKVVNERILKRISSMYGVTISPEDLTTFLRNLKRRSGGRDADNRTAKDRDSLAGSHKLAGKVQKKASFLASTDAMLDEIVGGSLKGLDTGNLQAALSAKTNRVSKTQTAVRDMLTQAVETGFVAGDNGSPLAKAVEQGVNLIEEMSSIDSMTEADAAARFFGGDEELLRRFRGGDNFGALSKDELKEMGVKLASSHVQRMGGSKAKSVAVTGSGKTTEEGLVSSVSELNAAIDKTNDNVQRTTEMIDAIQANVTNSPAAIHGQTNANLNKGRGK